MRFQIKSFYFFLIGVITMLTLHAISQNVSGSLKDAASAADNSVTSQKSADSNSPASSAPSPASSAPSATIAGKQPVLHFFTEPTKFMGDRNHALGVMAAFKNYCVSQNIPYQEKEWTADKYAEFLEFIKADLKAAKESISLQHIVLGVGTHGLEVLNKLCETESDLTDQLLTVWSGHQYIAGLEKLSGKINMMALPTHAITEPVKKFIQSIPSNSKTNTSLVPMIGVPHNVTVTTVNEALLKWQTDKSLPPLPNVSNDKPLDKPLIGVILGGDAPDETGKQHYFTPEEAADFAQSIAKLAKQSSATVLVTNGPRTGKFDPKSGQEQKVHKEDSALDKTTQAFVQVLQDAHISYALFDFKFGKPSAYQPILALLNATKSPAFVTGESTSFVSEMSDILPQGSLNIVRVGSMNPVHLAHMEEVTKSKQALSYKPAAETLVIGIVSELEKMNNKRKLAVR